MSRDEQCEFIKVIEFLKENNLHLSAHCLEKETCLLFDLNYLLELIQRTKFKDAIRYLKKFVMKDESTSDLITIKLFYDLSLQRYLDAICANNKMKAKEILINELRPLLIHQFFPKYNDVARLLVSPILPEETLANYVPSFDKKWPQYAKENFIPHYKEILLLHPHILSLLSLHPPKENSKQRTLTTKEENPSSAPSSSAIPSSAPSSSSPPSSLRSQPKRDKHGRYEKNRTSSSHQAILNNNSDHDSDSLSPPKKNEGSNSSGRDSGHDMNQSTKEEEDLITLGALEEVKGVGKKEITKKRASPISDPPRRKLRKLSDTSLVNIDNPNTVINVIQDDDDDDDEFDDEFDHINELAHQRASSGHKVGIKVIEYMKGKVFTLAADGTILINRDNDGSFVLERFRNFVTHPQMNNTENVTWNLKSSSNGQWILSSSGERVSLFSLQPPKERKTFFPNKPYATCVSFFPLDNNFNVIGDEEGLIHVTQVNKENSVHILKAHTRRVVCLTFTEKLLASAALDGKVCFWDTSKNFKLVGKIDLLRFPKLKKSFVSYYLKIEFINDQSLVVTQPEGITLYSLKANTDKLSDIGGKESLCITHSNFISTNDNDEFILSRVSADKQSILGITNRAIYEYSLLSFGQLNRRSFLKSILKEKEYISSVCSHPTIPGRYLIGTSQGDFVVLS